MGNISNIPRKPRSKCRYHECLFSGSVFGVIKRYRQTDGHTEIKPKINSHRESGDLLHKSLRLVMSDRHIFKGKRKINSFPVCPAIPSDVRATQLRTKIKEPRKHLEKEI